MREMKYRRVGVSLIEILIVLGILAILFGLILVAVQKVRLAGMRAASENNLRQIVLGFHQLSDQRAGIIKNLTQTELPKKAEYKEESIFYAILPWTYGERKYVFPPQSEADYDTIFGPKVAVYLDPADPSLDYHPVFQSSKRKICYVANILSFEGQINYPFTIQDGTTNTIAFAQHYFYCKATEEVLDYTKIFASTDVSRGGGFRRATFADKGWGDVMPVVNPGQPTTPSQPGKTFQVSPRVEDANSRVPQSPFPSGLPVALFDGSVRTLSPSIHESIFWGLVTPSGGEVLGDY